MGARKENRDARSYERALREGNQRLDEYEATVAALQAQLTELRGDVTRLEAEKTGLAKALETERRRADRMAGWAGTMQDNWLAEQRGHQKLSKIVRLALTPEQLNRYREIVQETTQ